MSYQPNKNISSEPFVHSEDDALDELFAMLRTMRPAYSVEERRFIRKWIKPLGTKSDVAGNEIVELGDDPHVLWSCHTDTVHHRQGPQRIELFGDEIRLASDEKRANCLGADCTTGVWLMRQMILAQIPGVYVFHAAEEIGGHGSRHIAKQDNSPFLDRMLYAIAFDRRGKKDVITHQGWSRCASEAFAKSIAEQLPEGYRGDDGGIFTDTANYTSIIPECSNLSVGYRSEHSKNETQSVSHALALRQALLKIDSSQFICKRDPSVKEYKSYDWGDYNWRDWKPKRHYSAGKSGFGSSIGATSYEKNVVTGLWETHYQGIEDDVWVKRNGTWILLGEEIKPGPIQDTLKGATRSWIKRDGSWRDEHDDAAYVARFSGHADMGNEEEDPLAFQDWTPPDYKW